jgi:hypothetical protein
MEDALQASMQVQTKMLEIKNDLTKEQGKSAELQSAVHALKEEIRSTPTYASVTRSSKQVQRTTCNAPKKHVLFVQSKNKDNTSKEIKNELVNKRIRQTRANSIIMEFDTRSDLEKFKDHPFKTHNIEDRRTKKKETRS